MGDWNTPTIADLYTDWDTMLQARADSQACLFDDGVTWTNLPSGAIKWNSGSSRFEKWNGATWANLSTALTDVCKIANNLSDLASASTARTNLGLGSIAVLNSPLAVANGGTGSTSASAARTALGLGTIATQAASAVAITGGTLAGITAITLASSSTIDFTSAGIISKLAQITSASHITLTTASTAQHVIFSINGTTRFSVTSVGIIPGATTTYDIGDSGAIVRNAYIQSVLSSVIDSASDLTVKISGTTRLVLSSTGGHFRPNTNGSQNLGDASYRWATFYVDSINGAQTSIHLSDSSDVHIRYLANTGGDHKFYAALGSTETFRIESTGKLYPILVGRPDYNITYGWSVRRTITGSETLAQLTDAVSTIIADLVAVGLAQ